MQLEKLRAEFEILSNRYGLTPPPELTRMLTAEQRRRYRIRHLQSMIEDAQIELGILRKEIEGLSRGMELALSDAIDTARREHNEGWSPVPVTAYRLWSITDDKIHGFRVQWTRPNLEASCGYGAGEDEVPHTDGRCGPPQCGIYAAKNPIELLECHRGFAGEWLLGRVMLSGKVVEHERGYRAKRAVVVAILGFDSRGSYEVSDPVGIEQLFDRPSRRRQLHRTSGILPRFRAESFFAPADRRTERNQPWT